MNKHKIIKFAVLLFLILVLCIIVKTNYVRYMKSAKSRYNKNITNSFKEILIQDEEDIDTIGEILLLAIENDVKLIRRKDVYSLTGERVDGATSEK